MYIQEYFGLDGKVALVTGGSRGIGKEVAKDLAKAGAKIALFSRTPAIETVNSIEKLGGTAKSYIVDVADEESVKKAMSNIMDDFGTLDIVFNNAGITIHKPFLEATAQDWKKIIDINIMGEVYVAKEAAKIMIAKNIKGSIINMASMSGSIVNIPQQQTLYNVTKAAIIHLTKCLAVELAEYGIRVNSISPGYTRTAMSENVPKNLIDAWMKLIPMGRMALPSEISGIVLLLACDNATYITGTDIIIDGGYTCL